MEISRVKARKLTPEAPLKSVKIAYLLLCCSGLLGIHRMYLGRWLSGLAYMAVSMLALIAWEKFALVALFAGCVIDLFLIPRLTTACNARIEAEYRAHPERFILPDDGAIAPWALQNKSGLLYALKTPGRILSFVMLPALFTSLCVITGNEELIVFPVIILLAAGLITSLDQIVQRYPALLNLPGIDSALERVGEIRGYYWNNEPRLGGSLLGMFTRARTEYKPYWKMVGVIALAIVIDAIFSFKQDYAPYLTFADAFDVILGQIIVTAGAIMLILSPLSALSYHYSLSGKRIRLRILTVTSLMVIAISFWGLKLIAGEQGMAPLMPTHRLELRLEKDEFKEKLHDYASMFLSYYKPAYAESAEKDSKKICSDSDSRNTCKPTVRLREMLGGLAPNEEKDMFEVFDIKNEFGENRPWRGVRYIGTTERRVIAVTDGDIHCTFYNTKRDPVPDPICQQAFARFTTLEGDPVESDPELE